MHSVVTSRTPVTLSVSPSLPLSVSVSLPPFHFLCRVLKSTSDPLWNCSLPPLLTCVPGPRPQEGRDLPSAVHCSFRRTHLTSSGCSTQPQGALYVPGCCTLRLRGPRSSGWSPYPGVGEASVPFVSPAVPGVCSRPGGNLRLQEGLRWQEVLRGPPRVLSQGGALWQLPVSAGAPFPPGGTQMEGWMHQGPAPWQKSEARGWG